MLNMAIEKAFDAEMSYVIFSMKPLSFSKEKC